VIAMGSTFDRLERPLRDLRISVTDRCNLRCGYCMPREVFGRDFAFLDRPVRYRLVSLSGGGSGQAPGRRRQRRRRR